MAQDTQQLLIDALEADRDASLLAQAVSPTHVWDAGRVTAIVERYKGILNLDMDSEIAISVLEKHAARLKRRALAEAVQP